MRKLAERPLTDDFSGAWCDSSLLTSSIMEAVSFVTPLLESFSIKAVADGLTMIEEGPLAEHCREFMREESYHSRVHRKLNSRLHAYLGKDPAGLALVSSLLDRSRDRLSVSSRLALGAALEHVTAVVSRAYAAKEANMEFTSSFTRELFAKHAEEEIGHRSVVFNLWHAVAAGSRLKRFMTIGAVLLVGSVYISISVPWILHKKTGKRLTKTFSAIRNWNGRKGVHTRALIGELFAFSRRNYHPDQLYGDDAARHIGY